MPDRAASQTLAVPKRPSSAGEPTPSSLLNEDTHATPEDVAHGGELLREAARHEPGGARCCAERGDDPGAEPQEAARYDREVEFDAPG